MFDFLKKPVNFVFALHLLIVFFVALGAIPRIWSWAIVALIVPFVILRPLKESIILFSRSIPFYIALPITATFDSFNMWRIVTALIALKWIFAARKDIVEILKNKFSASDLKSIWNKNKIEILGLAFFAISFLSLFQAAYLFAGIKRLIYFVNLSLIFPAVVWIFKNKIITIREISKNILVSLFLVVAVGYLQLLSTYALNIGEFVTFWAGQIQEGFYGKGWSQIVFSSNTWFSYNTDNPKLRMFSTFPDSHSFPLYILMAMPALMALSYGKIRSIKPALDAAANSAYRNFREYISAVYNFVRTNRKTLAWLGAVFLVFLAMVLSGTRGIWASVVFPIFFYAFLVKLPDMKKYARLSLIKTTEERRIAKTVIMALLLFFVAFAASYPILSKEQFLLRGEPSEQRDKLLGRVRSIVDASETSNSLRIEIWKSSIKSIAKNPVLGVGIGNFPVVLSQNISTQKAGASAHNLYLNILAETGVASLIVFFAICFLAMKYAWEIFRMTKDNDIKIYSFAFLLYTSWVFGYNLTDAALFDEREFLMFILTIGIIVGIRKQFEAAKQQ